MRPKPTIACLHCGAAFHPQYLTHRYCSRDCANAAFKTPASTRFWAMVDRTANDGCWIWTAAKDRDGYGLFTRSVNHQTMAHRMSWELSFGPIPPNTLVCHQCDNPSCVRPSHLFLGSNTDNMADMVRKGRSLRGQHHPRAKLTENDVRMIRKLSAAGMSDNALAEQFHVSPAAIYLAVKRRSWKYVE